LNRLLWKQFEEVGGDPRSSRSDLLEAATAAGIVAVVYSHTAVREEWNRTLCLKSGAAAVVNR
jgi:hypothetical protein